MANSDTTSRTASIMIDIPTLAAELCISVKTIRRMAQCGRMPAPIKLMGRVLFRRADIEKWVSDGCPRCDRRHSRDAQASQR